MECSFSHLKPLADTGYGVIHSICLWACFLLCENFQVDGAVGKGERRPTSPPGVADTVPGARHTLSDPGKCLHFDFFKIKEKVTKIIMTM